MYPDPILFGMTLYEFAIVFGFFFSVLTFRIFADRRKFPAALQNIAIIGGTVGIALGYYAAVLVQSFYHYIATGKWEVAGATFQGGLLGGAITFLTIYFVGGYLIYRGKENLTITRITEVTDLAFISIVIAHAFGRLGCLAAGCCHGAIVDGFPGLWNETVGAYTIPIPLYEALFLFALYAVMCVCYAKKKGYISVIYLTSYGVWRFIIEYFRADDRGQTIVPFLSPSQLISLCMIAIAVIVFFVRNRKKTRGPVENLPESSAS